MRAAALATFVKSRIVAILACALVALTFAIAVIAAQHDGWRPLGDDAAISVLTHDVFSVRSPLVGMPSTIGINSSIKTPTHHPGPLLFWALAPFDFVTRSAPIGFLLGAGIINLAAILAAAWLTSRLAGRAAGLAAIAIALVAEWALGKQFIVSVWNPRIAVFPLFALLVFTWAVVAGRNRALWGVVLLASFAAQTHLLYLPLAFILFVAASSAVGYTLSRRAEHNEPWRREAALVVGVALAIGLAVWSFPVADDIVGHPGNFTALGNNMHTIQSSPIGPDFAVRAVVQTVEIVPLFARQSANQLFTDRSWSQLGVLGIGSALVVLGALLAGTVLAFRRRDRVGTGAGLTALTALVVLGVMIARLPVPTGLPTVPPYYLLQCWAVGAFVWLAAAIVVARALPERVRATPGLRMAGAVAACGLALVMPFAIARANSYGRDNPRVAQAVGSLASQVAAHVDHRGPYSIEVRTDAGLTGFSAQGGLLHELIRHGVSMGVVPNDIFLAPYLERSHTVPDGSPRLILVVGNNNAGVLPPAARLVASYDGARASDKAQLRVAEADLSRLLRDPAQLTAKGRAVLQDHEGQYADVLAGLENGTTDPGKAWLDGDLDRLITAGLLQPTTEFSVPMQRYIFAEEQADHLVFNVYAVPPQ